MGTTTTGKNRPEADQRTWRKKLQPGRIKFDDERKGTYLKQLREHGKKILAAEFVGITPQTVKNHLKADPEFEEAYNDALGAYAESISKVVYERGVKGWRDPVYQKGERVRDFVLNDDGTVKVDTDGNPVFTPAHVEKFSERMLELEACRVMPDYRSNWKGGSGTGGGVMIAPATMTPKEWISTEEDKNKERVPPKEI